MSDFAPFGFTYNPGNFDAAGAAGTGSGAAGASAGAGTGSGAGDSAYSGASVGYNASASAHPRAGLDASTDTRTDTRTGASAGPNIGGSPTQLFAWQICLAHLDQGALEDASNYPDYVVNRDKITQTLGLGMANGQNAFPLNDQMFVVAIGVQVPDKANPGALVIELISPDHGHYKDISLVIAEQLLRGEDHGMVALLPNGNLVPFTPQPDISDL